MQEKNRRDNKTRSAEMRARLMAAARALFVEKGYAETGTPEIVKRADVTRGALYHHFTDKADLFRAVIEAEAAAVGQEIDGATDLEGGSAAFFSAMAVEGRARLLIIDGPAVLGHSVIDQIDAGAGRARLAAGLDHALPDVPASEKAALTLVLSAAFDRAALAVAEGDDAAPYLEAFIRLFRVMV